MIKIRNLSGMNSGEIFALQKYFAKSPDEAMVTNRRKNQYVFRHAENGKSFIVKTYFHRHLKHRIASSLGHGNADRYTAIATYLQSQNLPVPQPLLILKTGRGLLPEQTLLALEEIDGRMLSTLLPDLETDLARSAFLAPKIASLILGLRNAGVIHRDLNTKNFLISDRDDVTLIDFDAARKYRRHTRAFHKRHQRDIQSFMATCKNAPRFASEVASLLQRKS